MAVAVRGSRGGGGGFGIGGSSLWSFFSYRIFVVRGSRGGGGGFGLGGSSLWSFFSYRIFVSVMFSLLHTLGLLNAPSPEAPREARRASPFGLCSCYNLQNGLPCEDEIETLRRGNTQSADFPAVRHRQRSKTLTKTAATISRRRARTPGFACWKICSCREARMLRKKKN